LLVGQKKGLSLDDAVFVQRNTSPRHRHRRKIGSGLKPYFRCILMRNLGVCIATVGAYHLVGPQTSGFSEDFLKIF
jgi:hypothetical protein